MQLRYPTTNKLLPFQIPATEETIHFLQTNPANACYNACEMGLGKTIQAIVAANTLGCRKILIICPAIMRLVWRDELYKWLDNSYDDSIMDHLTTLSELKRCTMFDVILDWKNVNEAITDSWNGPRCLITSYELATTPKLKYWIESQDWDLLIMDEAHYLKNTRAKRTKTILHDFWPKAKYKLALSGTPFTTRVIDGYTLFRRMMPGRWVDFNAFAEEFSYKQIKRIGIRVVTDYFGVKNPEVLRKLIRDNFYVRYTKEEVLKDLPDKIYNKITLPSKYAIMPKGKTESDKLKIEAELIQQAIAGDKLPPIPKCLAEHRRLQGEQKVPAVIEFVKNLLEQNIPIVLYAWHKNVIVMLRDAFQEYNPAVITGETPVAARAEAVNAFQGGSTLLFIGNIIAAGIGITLTKASTVVLAELDWSPASVAQAIDRCHRIGQVNPVNVYYFVVEFSIDESINNTVMSRARTFKSVLDGKN